MSESKKSIRGRMPQGQPNPVDAFVGEKMRTRRLYMQISQEELAEKMAITFQQVQKYERGINRLSASRLFDLSQVMRVPVQYFFDGITSDVAQLSPRNLANATKEIETLPVSRFDPFLSKRAVDLVRLFSLIPDKASADKIYDLISTMSLLSGKEFPDPPDDDRLFEKNPYEETYFDDVQTRTKYTKKNKKETLLKRSLD